MNSELDQIESSQRQFLDHKEHQNKMDNIIQEGEMLNFVLLKPKISIDGDQYCLLYGDDLQCGIAGFGDTIYKAIIDFNLQFHQPIKKNKG